MLDFFLCPPTNWLTFTKSVINQSLMDQFISNKVYCNGNNAYYHYNRFKKYNYDIIFEKIQFFIFFTRRNNPGVAVGGCLADPQYCGRRRTRVKNLYHQRYYYYDDII